MSREVNWDFKFDPPSPRHFDGTIIRDECNCDECHKEHDIREQNGDPDFQCCTDDFEARIEDGKICPKKPKEHFDIYMAGSGKSGRFVLEKPGRCLECEHEAKCDKPDHSACAN